jgi:hypothetical protein
MKIIVIKGSCQIDQSGELGQNCIEADPITEPLAITPDVLQMRGEWWLQNNGNNWRDVQVSGPDTGQYTTGDIIEVTGTDFGNFVGKIISISYSDNVDPAQSTVTLIVRKLIGSVE